MFKSAIAIVLLAGAATAQVNSTYIDPSTVDALTKSNWCTGQRSACSTLCSGNAPTNNCDPTLLTYSCLCNNGTAPDLADYLTTLPDFICQKSFGLCIEAHPNDLAGQTACKTNIQSKCGFLNLANFTNPAVTTSSAPATTAASSTAAPASTAPSTTGSAAPAATTSAKPNGAYGMRVEYGAGVVAGAAALAFSFLL